jgi:uncharacterized phage protein (TIGR02218 family)
VSLDITERSLDSGSPQELFLFAQGGSTWGFTGADSTINFSGRTYTKESIARSAVRFSQEESSGAITIRVPVTNAVAQRFLGVMPAIPMFVTITRIHRNGSAAVQYQGRVAGLASVTKGEATLNVEPFHGVLSRRLPLLDYQSQCNYPVYGPGCGVNVEANTASVTVSTVSGSVVTGTGFGAKPDGWYQAGWLELASGTYAGDRRGIKAHVGTSVTLVTPFASLAGGAVVKAVKGCLRTEAACIEFNNLARFMGFTRIPNRNPYKGRMA